MNRGRGSQAGGYTIVETLIFLAVSGAMFVAAMIFLGGQQARTEFHQAVHDFETNLESTANDVNNGYYSDLSTNGNPLTCKAPGGNIVITDPADVDTQGTNQDCTFIGKGIQFGPKPNGSEFPDDPPKETFNTITLVGKRLAASGKVAQSLAESGVKATVQVPGPGGNANSYQNNLLGYGASISCVFYFGSSVTLNAAKPCATAGANYIDTIAFVTTFVGASGGGLNSGSTQVDLVVPTAAATPPRLLKDAAETLNTFVTAADIVVNPPSGVYVCIQSGGTRQFGLIKLGGNNSQFSTSSTITSGGCS
jgi:hypothetical protein